MASYLYRTARHLPLLPSGPGDSAGAGRIRLADANIALKPKAQSLKLFFGIKALTKFLITE